MKIKKLLLPLAPLVAYLIFFEWFARASWIPSYLLPPPMEVIHSLIDDRLEIWTALLGTLQAATLGFVLSTLVGIAAALFLSSAQFLKAMFYPYAIFFQTVPIVAIAPILVIWFGFGQPTVIASALICSIFPVIASTMTGLEATDRSLLDLFKLYRTTRIQTLLRCRFPSALPFLVSGLRVASGLAIIGAIVGEFVGGGGLGGLIEASRSQQRLDRVFAAVLASSMLGAVFVIVVNAASRLLLSHWHSLGKEPQ